MKRLIPVLLCLALLLCGCSQESNIHTVEYGGVTLTVDRENRTISDGKYSYSYLVFGAGANNQMTYHYTFFYPDRSEYTLTREIVGGSVVSSEDTWTVGVYQQKFTSPELLMQALDNLPEVKESKIEWQYLITGIVAIAMGLWNLFFTDVSWAFEHMFTSFMYSDPELTDEGRSWVKTGGGIAVGVGVILLLIAFF